MLRSVEVRTGEAVALRYELAGLGSRFLAVSIDMAAQLAILLAIVVGAAFGSQALLRLVPSRNVAAWGIALVVVVLFVVLIGWFIVFETWWSGRTPGKRALGLRVVRDGGFPLDPGAAVIRNLVRLIELGLGFYAVSAISTLLSKENKRLGDFAAGTIVVRDRSEIAPDLHAYLASPADGGSGISPSDRVLVRRFLARRFELEPAARASLAAALAQRIRPALRASYAHLDDESLLEFVAER